MSKVLIDEQALYDIGDAIRERDGIETTYLPSQMASAIRSSYASKTMILGGGANPSDSYGNNGDLYIKYRTSKGVTGYQFLRNISVGTAGPYIDTGAKCTNEGYFYIKAQYTATPGNNYGIFGSMLSGREFVVNCYGGILYATAGGSRCVFTSSPTDVHEFYANENGIELDGALTSATVDWNAATNNNYHIFAFDLGGTKYTTANASVYACKIWDGESLVRDYVPAKRVTDNEIGLYDWVTDEFYTNSGSGSFQAGPDADLVDGPIMNVFLKKNGTWIQITDGSWSDLSIEGESSS